MRATEAERVILGRLPGLELFREAGRLAAQASRPISDVRASVRYRHLLVQALVPRALQLCVDRIGEART
jgi:carbon-monoxide dehydrogenase medium subunit